MVGCVEGILGLRPDLGGIRIAPSIPANWDHIEIDKHFRGKSLHIVVNNPDKKESGCTGLILNGKELSDNYILAEYLKEKNEIIVNL